MRRRSRSTRGGIRVGLIAVPFAIALGCTGIALAEPGPVQPGVTAPATPDNEEHAELRAATPPAPAQAPRPRPSTPEKTETPPPPNPHSIRIGDSEVPVPEFVPDAVVDGLQNAIPGNPPKQ
ncbi:hypothetical protein ACWDSJ_13385 [Nocardia sp. NPDC003482]